MTALAHAFGEDHAGWTPSDHARQVLMATDDASNPVKKKKANAILKALCTHGYVERHTQFYRLTLPSLAGHFGELRGDMDPQSQAMRAIQAALSERDVHARHDHT